MHTMHYIDAATTGIISPHVLPVEDLRKVLLHIAEALPLTMHLPVSSEDTLPNLQITMHPHFEADSSSSSSMYLYRIMHRNLKYMKSST